VIPLEFHLTLKPHGFKFPMGDLVDRKEQKNTAGKSRGNQNTEDPPELPAEVKSCRELIKISRPSLELRNQIREFECRRMTTTCTLPTKSL
jgi:hypothetical protein